MGWKLVVYTWQCRRCGSFFSTSKLRHAVKCGCGTPMTCWCTTHGRVYDCGDFRLRVVPSWE